MEMLIATTYRRGVGKQYLEEISALRREFYDFHAQYGMVPDSNDVKDWWRADDVYQLFLENGEVIGYIRFQVPEKREYYYIHTFVIAERMRGKGYGRQALALARDYAKKQVAAELAIGSEYANKRAWGLYQSFGFHIEYVGVKKDL